MPPAPHIAIERAGAGTLEGEDMTTNGNEASRHYQDAVTAQMGERITNLGRRQSDLESEMRSGFRSMEASITAFTNETRTSIAALSQTLAERSRPQWQALGVALTFAAMLGALAYWPIREATNDLKASTNAISAVMVTRQEMDWRQQRSQEDRLRTEGAIVDMRANLIPRAEHERVWQNYDQRFADQQRQIDEVKQAQNSVYGARDVLMDMRERLDRLEQQRRSQSLLPP